MARNDSKEANKTLKKAKERLKRAEIAEKNAKEHEEKAIKERQQAQKLRDETEILIQKNQQTESTSVVINSTSVIAACMLYLQSGYAVFKWLSNAYGYSFEFSKMVKASVLVTILLVWALCGIVKLGKIFYKKQIILFANLITILSTPVSIFTIFLGWCNIFEDSLTIALLIAGILIESFVVIFFVGKKH